MTRISLDARVTINRLRAELAGVRSELAGMRAEEQQARHLSLHDSLTSLPNRRHFLQKLCSALARSDPQAPVALLYLDLDAFKPINDMHGHDAGDEVLAIVAARLSRAVRSSDLMSRLGGDEFACLPAKLHTSRQLGCLARNLIKAVSAPIRIGELTLCVRPSIGIATFPADGATAREVLAAADRAMYQAKQDRTGYAFAVRAEQACAPAYESARRIPHEQVHSIDRAAGAADRECLREARCSSSGCH